MKRRNSLALLLLAAVLAALVGFLLQRAAGPCPIPDANAQQTGLPQWVAGPGRVEPVSEDIKLGSAVSGRIKHVHVHEGEAVERGQVLAELENDDYAAAIRAAGAEVRIKRAELDKLLNGAHAYERASALAAQREAAALLLNAQTEAARRRKLFATHVVSKQELELFSSTERVVQARHTQAKLHRELLTSPPRMEDRAIAEAEVELALARLDEAQARYEKTLIRSPIDGSVLRKHHREGETVSDSSALPDPILTVGNKDTLRVRVEIDESDVGRLTTGRRAYVTADAFRGRKFWGGVVAIGELLGRKNVRSDDPNERIDTKVLEVVLELQPEAPLLVGLRVDAFIEAAAPEVIAQAHSPH